MNFYFYDISESIGWPWLAMVSHCSDSCHFELLAMALDGWDLWKCCRLLAREASKNPTFMYSGVSTYQRPVDTRIYCEMHFFWLSQSTLNDQERCPLSYIYI